MADQTRFISSRAAFNILWLRTGLDEERIIRAVCAAGADERLLARALVSIEYRGRRPGCRPDVLNPDHLTSLLPSDWAAIAVAVGAPREDFFELPTLTPSRSACVNLRSGSIDVTWPLEDGQLCSVQLVEYRGLRLDLEGVEALAEELTLPELTAEQKVLVLAGRGLADRTGEERPRPAANMPSRSDDELVDDLKALRDKGYGRDAAVKEVHRMTGANCRSLATLWTSRALRRRGEKIGK